MPRIFISYKTGGPNERNNFKVNELHGALKRKYGDDNVFLDTKAIHGGKDWDDTIYEELAKTDVLILMVSADVLDSRWVQREVDFARGFRILTLPVVVFDDDLKTTPGKSKNTVTEVLEALALPTRQYAQALSSTPEEDRYNRLFRDIDLLVPETRKGQKELIEQLYQRWKEEDDRNPELQPAEPNLRHSEFVYDAPDGNPYKTRVFLATGSITELEGADVLVNSENVYMQMQRVFAPISVSSTIRLMGSRGDWINGIIEEDTVQNKLNDEVYAFRGKLPVRQCDVFVTPAGDDSSELKKHNIRFIYHVAVVKASLKGEEKLEGVDGERVVQICVRNCLEKVKTHNTTNPTTPIKRIVFPLLGAGNAGLKVDVSAKQVVEGIKWWLERNVDPNLEGIHINAFRVCDVKTVLAVMNGSRLRSVSISRF